MSNAVYPYRVHFPRTNNWWGPGWEGGDWAKISSWCNETIGKGEWEYYAESFVFCEEKHKMLFQMRWL